MTLKFLQFEKKELTSLRKVAVVVKFSVLLQFFNQFDLLCFVLVIIILKKGKNQTGSKNFKPKIN